MYNCKGRFGGPCKVYVRYLPFFHFNFQVQAETIFMKKVNFYLSANAALVLEFDLALSFSPIYSSCPQPHPLYQNLKGAEKKICVAY